MTVIRPNSVSGITSITAQANEINFFRSNGALAGLQLNGVNFNTTTGVSTFNNLDVGGVLTYQDVTNVDSIGIITARSTIDAQGDVSIADKIIHTGDTNTAIRFPSADTITAETAGTERLRITSSGEVKIMNTSGTVGLYFQSSSGAVSNLRAIGTNNQSLGYFFGNSEKFRFASSGNIGIATDISGAGGAYGRLSVVIPSQAGGAALQVMNSATGSGDGSLNNIVLRSTNNAGTQWSGAEFRAHEYTFKNQAVPALSITSTGCVFANNIGIGTDNRWKIRPNTNYTELAFEYSTSTTLADTNIKMALKSDSVDVLSDFAIKSSLAKMSMIDTDGGDYFQLRNDGGTFKIRNSTDGRDDISITNNALTFGGVAKITDNNSIFFGNDNDIEMRHNATSSQNQIICKNHNFLLQSYGTLYMQCFQSGNSTNGNVLTANYNAGTALYYQNGERIVTTNAGCKISNGLVMDGWLNISRNGTYAPASVGHTANSAEGIFWHSAIQYSIFRTSGSWGGPNYQQLQLNWPTGIHIDGGYNYGLSGARFNCHALPYVDNNFDLGLSNRRWDDIYATNTSIVSSSDENLKEEITSLTAAEMKAAKRLSGLFKKFKWKSAVAEKGSAARTHTGIIAQHVKTAMEAEGLDPTIYAFFCFDEWYENDKKEVITLDQLKDDIPDPLDSSKTLTPPSTEGYTKVSRYSIRYTELLSFISAYNDQRFADLESRVAALEGS